MRNGTESIVNGWHISGFSDVGVLVWLILPEKTSASFEAIIEKRLVPCVSKLSPDFKDSDQASTLHNHSS